MTRELGWSGLHVRPHSVQSRGPGNVLLLTAIHEHVTEVTAGFGARRKSAEGVANDAIREMRAYLEHDAPVGPHLADQLIIPIALAGGTFRATEMTLHSETNIDVCNRFLERQVQAMRDEERRDGVCGGGVRALV